MGGRKLPRYGYGLKQGAGRGRISKLLQERGVLLERIVSLERNVELLRRQVDHDPLTGLPNRNLLKERMAQILAYEKRHQGLAAVLVLDVDDFKGVNDRYGHHIGDAVLKVIARRMQESVRGYDTVARIGGDEFVLVISDLTDMERLYAFADKLVSLFEHSFDVEGVELAVGVSIGVAVFPVDGVDADLLLRKADAAMYACKSRGKNLWSLYGTRPVGRDVYVGLQIEPLLRGERLQH